MKRYSITGLLTFIRRFMSLVNVVYYVRKDLFCQSNRRTKTKADVRPRRSGLAGIKRSGLDKKYLSKRPRQRAIPPPARPALSDCDCELRLRETRSFLCSQRGKSDENFVALSIRVMRIGFPNILAIVRSPLLALIAIATRT